MPEGRTIKAWPAVVARQRGVPLWLDYAAEKAGRLVFTVEVKV